MSLTYMLERALDFGTSRSRESFVSFTVKIILYIIPAVIFGHYTDIFIQTIQKHKYFGDNPIAYIVLHTIAIIITLYAFVIFFEKYTSEFQKTIAGSFFIVLYFGVQPNYILMMKDYMKY